MQPLKEIGEQRVREFLEETEDVAPDASTWASREDFSQIGRHWRAIGLAPGDLVLLALPSSAAALRHFFGVLSVGLVPALAPPGAPWARLRDMAQALGARAVGSPRLSRDTSRVTLVRPVAHLQVAEFHPEHPAPTQPGDVVVLTSGTSGISSGCVFPLGALLLNAERHAASIGQSAADVVLLSLPLYFSFGLVAQALACLLTGARLVIAGPPFHRASYLRTLRQEGIAISSLTPLLVQGLLSQSMGFPEQLRVLTVGGDALPEERARHLLAMRPNRKLFITYGLTEAGPRVSTLAAHQEPPHRLVSVGKPLPGTRVRLEPLSDGSNRRQLIVMSETVMRQRIGRLEGRPPDDLSEPGAVATGDIFDQDGDGYLYFQGRRTDFLTRGDEKISLASVRRVAAQLPQVLRATTRVFSGAGGRSDYELRLLVTGGEKEAHRRHLAQRLCRHEWPGRLVIEIGNGHALPHK